jgi:hypothetical protein
VRRPGRIVPEEDAKIDRAADDARGRLEQDRGMTLNHVLIGNFGLGGARIEVIADRLEKVPAALGWLPARLGDRDGNGRGVGRLAARRSIVF